MDIFLREHVWKMVFILITSIYSQHPLKINVWKFREHKIQNTSNFLWGNARRYNRLLKKVWAKVSAFYAIVGHLMIFLCSVGTLITETF